MPVSQMSEKKSQTTKKSKKEAISPEESHGELEFTKFSFDMKDHNKSGKSKLSVAQLSPENFKALLKKAESPKHQRKVMGIVHGSECVVHTNKDGKIRIGTGENEIHTYAYQLVFGKTYGFQILEAIPSSKTSKEHPCISHSCGLEGCLTPTHFGLRNKYDNDTRQHCHYGLRILRDKNQKDYENAYKAWRELKLCPHDPICGSCYDLDAEKEFTKKVYQDFCNNASKQ